MGHPMDKAARKAHGSKLNILGGKGEYPPDRAARIAGAPLTNADAQGDAARAPEERWTRAPGHQVSNYGRSKGE